MTIKDKIQLEVNKIEFIGSKLKPAEFEINGHLIEVRKNAILIRYNKSAISYRANYGLTKDKIEECINDAISHFARVKNKIGRKNKK